MKRFFCDRCGVEVTGKRSGAASGVEDADENGDGTSTHHADHLCRGCYRAFVIWLTLLHTSVVKKPAGKKARS